MGIAVVGIGMMCVCGVVIVMAVAMVIMRVAETLLAMEGHEQQAEAVATQLFCMCAWISAASMMVSFE
ncbi:hypothetical protein G6F46_015350 [Rhizopus delemar]|nr:hypothetical protein G6F23_015978 [Rhizopus arrhizus]KAG1581501.1 hypothetical protein G6F46_015350 [Rhizopus delemar]